MTYVSITDAEALEALLLCTRLEGIIPALESAHALAWIIRERESMAGQTVVLSLSGRGDKDVEQVSRLLGPAAGADRGLL